MRILDIILLALLGIIVYGAVVDPYWAQEVVREVVRLVRHLDFI